MVRRRALGRAAVLGAIAILAACAEVSGPPPSIAGKIQQANGIVDLKGMAAVYGPLQEREPYSGLRVVRDVPYGPDPQTRVDVFTPEVSPAKPLPVLLFVHGGGFTQGDKRMGAGSPFYDNVGLWAARHGMIGVTINYRLAPKAQWPAAAEDVGLAVAWARKFIADFGGDPNRIFLMGHSAGATHVASYVSYKQFWTEATPAVAGAIIISGTFDLTADPVPADEKFFVDRERAYFGSDPSRQSTESSTAGLVASPVPLCIVNAQFDPPYFLRRAAQLKAAFAQAHRSDPFVVLPGENHMAEAFSMNTEDEGLSQAVKTCVE